MVPVTKWHSAIGHHSTIRLPDVSDNRMPTVFMKILSFWNTLGIRKDWKSRFCEDCISKGPILKGSGYSYGPYHLKTGLFKIWTFLFRFQMVLDKMAAICLDFKWSKPFPNWPLFEHSKSRHVQISNIHCTQRNKPYVKLEFLSSTFFFFRVKICVDYKSEEKWLPKLNAKTPVKTT